MQYVVKYFPEITIKSKPVRRQMCQQLGVNLRRLLREIDPAVRVDVHWDRLSVGSDRHDRAQTERMLAVLQQTPGIAHLLDVEEYTVRGIEDIAPHVVALWKDRLDGRTFAVRCKRSGGHGFSSSDIERSVGAALLQVAPTAGVDLGDPDVTVRLELRGDRLFVVNRRHEGMGGFPLGAADAVLSLVSGGFDSTVASYQMMRRGLQTHFLFFNLGGYAHERGVKEVCLYLWMKYGASHRVRFVTVPFEPVVAEILARVDDAYMGVVLKRLMLRAATRIAADLGLQALVTGEAVAQVSSQTLHNLAVIDRATDMLVLRPLVGCDKSDIVATSRAIGTEGFAAEMPEYCGVISVKPKTRARLERVEAQEQRFDASVLERAVTSAQLQNIDELGLSDQAAPAVELLAAPLAGSVIIDLRAPAEEERCPLRLPGVEIIRIPFYRLAASFGELDQSRRYLLYCDQGVMSRLQAGNLVQAGYGNVSVYRPAASTDSRTGSAPRR